MSTLAVNLDHQLDSFVGLATRTRAQADLQWRRRTDLQDAHTVMRLLDAFSDIGGLVNGDTLATLLRERTGQPISLLAGWIVHRRALSF